MGQVTSICPVDSLVLLGQALVAEISGSPQGQLREKNPSCSDHRRTTTEHAIKLTPLSFTPETPQMAGLLAFLTYWYTSLPPEKPLIRVISRMCHLSVRSPSAREKDSRSRTWGLHDPCPIGHVVVRMAPTQSTSVRVRSHLFPA